MKSGFLCVVFVLAMVVTASAWSIPYYRMDSLVLLSDVVVLCAEEDVQFKDVGDGKWPEIKTLVSCKVVQIFKGDMKLESEFQIDFDPIFQRNLVSKGTRIEVEKDTGVRRIIRAEYLPAGRALLFLKKNKDADSYSVLTAKLIQKDAILQFGQFFDNPGPLVLAGQQPEKIKLAATQKYGETQLIEDLLIASEKAASLTKPVRMRALAALKQVH